jgi:hypothetical protein
MPANCQSKPTVPMKAAPVSWLLLMSHSIGMAAMAATGSNANTRQVCSNVRFSNRPFRVKRFQTIHDSGVNVARGLALLL